MKGNQTYTGIVLLGGKSQRMGRDKSVLTFEGKKMAEHSIELLNEFCSEIILSGDHKPELEGNYVEDLHPNCGPMGGLYSALEKSSNELNIVLPCDTPMLNKNVINALLSEAKRDEITYARTDAGIHPLIGIFPKNCLRVIKRNIENKDFKMTELLDRFNSSSVYFSNEILFKNINSPEDLRS